MLHTALHCMCTDTDSTISVKVSFGASDGIMVFKLFFFLAYICGTLNHSCMCVRFRSLCRHFHWFSNVACGALPLPLLFYWCAPTCIVWLLLVNLGNIAFDRHRNGREKRKLCGKSAPAFSIILFHANDESNGTNRKWLPIKTLALLSVDFQKMLGQNADRHAARFMSDSTGLLYPGIIAI